MKEAVGYKKKDAQHSYEYQALLDRNLVFDHIKPKTAVANIEIFITLH